MDNNDDVLSVTVKIVDKEDMSKVGRPLSGNEVDFTVPGCSVMSVISEKPGEKQYFAYQSLTGRFLMVRVVPKEGSAQDWFKQFAPKMVAMNQGNAAKYYDVFETENEFKILTEYFSFNYTIRTIIQNIKKLDESIANRILWEISKGYSFLYKKGIRGISLLPQHVYYHQDTPKSIRHSYELFTSEEDTFKLGDYGLPHAKDVIDMQYNFQELAKTIKVMFPGDQMPDSMKKLSTDLKRGRFRSPDALENEMERRATGRRRSIFSF